MNEGDPVRKITIHDLELFLSSDDEDGDRELASYLNAAAVLAALDPFQLCPVSASAVNNETAYLERLLPKCEPITQGSGRGFWRLLLPERRGALKALGTRDAMQQALRANPHRPDISLQLMFERVVADERFMLAQASREDLTSLLTVHEWLDGILDDLPNRT